METKFLQRGEYLFQVGDPDDSIYVVQTGIITVSIKEPVSFFKNENIPMTQARL